jgi:hypothetical protein
MAIDMAISSARDECDERMFLIVDKAPGVALAGKMRA